MSNCNYAISTALDQTVLPIGAIAQRARALGVSIQQLCRDAGVNEATAWRVVKRGDCRMTIAARLSAALIARERAQLDRLAAIHGGER